jgi:hypothetical protein
MKRFLSFAIPVVAFSAIVLRVHATDPTDPVDPPVTQFGSQDCNALTDEYANSGPSVNANGYAGTFSWEYAISSGSLTYSLIYEVDYYDASTDTWSALTAGQLQDTDSGSGSHDVDMYVNPAQADYGDYGVTAWVVDGSNHVITSATYQFYYGSTSSPTYSAATYNYLNGSGDDPPTTQPALPPSGPVGPGSSS